MLNHTDPNQVPPQQGEKKEPFHVLSLTSTVEVIILGLGRKSKGFLHFLFQSKDFSVSAHFCVDLFSKSVESQDATYNPIII